LNEGKDLSKAVGCLCKKRKSAALIQVGPRATIIAFIVIQDGRFLDEGITLEEKINKNVKFAVQMGMSESDAMKMASNVLPKLKRWKEQGREPSDEQINHYWFGSKFLEYCLKQGWLRKEGSGGRGTKWYPTEKGRNELKEKFGIKV
jgi:hypothetical protein